MQNLEKVDRDAEDARLEACLEAVELDYLLSRCASPPSASSPTCSAPAAARRAETGLRHRDDIVPGWPTGGAPWKRQLTATSSVDIPIDPSLHRFRCGRGAGWEQVQLQISWILTGQAVGTIGTE